MLLPEVSPGWIQRGSLSNVPLGLVKISGTVCIICRHGGAVGLHTVVVLGVDRRCVDWWPSVDILGRDDPAGRGVNAGQVATNLAVLDCVLRAAGGLGAVEGATRALVAIDVTDDLSAADDTGHLAHAPQFDRPCVHQLLPA